MSESNSEEKGIGWLERIPSNPWITISLLIVAVISIIVAIVVPIIIDKSSRTERQLVYSVNPVYTHIVTAGQTSGIEVLHNGISLGDANLTAVQIAIWNMGRESIRPENILEGIVVYTNPTAPILEASIRKESRDAVGFVLSNSTEDLARGEVPLSWRILEQNDGASIQLVYLGSEDIGVAVKGVVEGLREMKRIDIGIETTTPEERVHTEGAINRISGILFTTFGALGILMTPIGFFARKQRLGLRKALLRYGPNSLVFIAFFGFGIWNLMQNVPSLPPFGF